MTYEELAREIGKTVDEKQAAYGDSFGQAGQVLRILYPNGVSPEHYDDLLAMVRVIDKLFRIATDKGAFGESPWKDCAGYSILAMAKEQERDAGSCGDDAGKEHRPSLRDLVNWSMAPEWAGWAAQDENGTISWFEVEPRLTFHDCYVWGYDVHDPESSKLRMLLYKEEYPSLAHDWAEPLRRPKKTCPKCNGEAAIKGMINYHTCSKCNGTGQVNAE